MSLLKKIPMWLKAIVIGFLILEISVRIWGQLASLNISTTPSIPWSCGVMLIILWLIWKYLNGNWFPESTQETRRLWMRANALKPEKRIWGWSSAVLLGLILIQLIFISMRLVEFPSGQIGQIERLGKFPIWTTISFFIMISLVAGIIEEIAFRGYMQKPMETAYGPKTAILIVALFFTLIHLPNVTIAPQLIPLFFVGSIGWGILAYLTNSIIPGVVIHTLVDLAGYFWTWNNLEPAKSMASESIIRNGADTSFIFQALMAVLTLVFLIFSFYKLSRIHIKNYK
jgi:membrane protease YdiL (CAAX protease family)